MINIIKLDNYNVSNKGYGGHSGSKKGIIINNQAWLIKYPKSTKSMNAPGLSYTTTPLSEYLGSQIYKSIGIDTHETLLGYLNNKIVVGCKDFLSNTEEIIDFNAIKNNYNEKIEDYLNDRHSSEFPRNDDINNVKYIMDNNYYFSKVPKLKERFWDMFIVDALINNNDRNVANWGLVLDKANGKLRVAPVFDNGACFYGKHSDDKIREILNNKTKFVQLAYDSCISVYTLNDKIINPLKYIESIKDEDCNKALVRIYEKISLDKIKEIFDQVPYEYNGMVIFSELQRELYYKVLEYRLLNILKPVYEKIVKK